MAYMSQELKAKLAPAIKAICKKYGIKASIAVRHNSTLVLNIKSGVIDFLGSYNTIAFHKGAMQAGNYIDVNPFWYREQFDGKALDYLNVNPFWYREQFDGKALDYLKEVIAAMNNGNHDNSDIQTDYFDVGWYIDVNVGKWDTPYIYLPK